MTLAYSYIAALKSINDPHQWMAITHATAPTVHASVPDEALQEFELDVGDAVYLIEEFVGNTRCLVLSKTPQIADRIDELTEFWNDEQRGTTKDK